MPAPEALQKGTAVLGVAADKQQIELMLAFTDLIFKWNKAYNLTAIKTREEMVKLHLLDSLTVLPYLTGQRIIDVGTGAGLPGIPLAICRPDLNFTLLDSNAKKTRFVRQALLELQLANVEVIHSRTEEYHPEPLFDTVVTRAFSELINIVALTRHLLTANGKLIAMKAKCQPEELAEVALAKEIIPVRIPGVDAERNLVCVYNAP